MKKATFRRVIFYMLIFSLTFTSVSTVLVRPVEVQASSGVMEGWEIFVGILSSLGFFSSSSSAGQTYYDKFMNWVDETTNFEDQVYSMFPTLPADLVEQGVEQTTANHMQISLMRSIVKLFDAGAFTSSDDISGNFSYNDGCKVTYELVSGHLRMVETYDNVNTVIIFECDVNKLVSGRKLSFSLGKANLYLADKEATEEAIKTYTLNLLNFLKKVVFNWIKSQAKSFSKNKVMLNNSSYSSININDSSVSIKNSIYLYLKNDIEYSFFKSSETSLDYHPGIGLANLISSGQLDFEQLYSKYNMSFPSEFFAYYVCNTYNGGNLNAIDIYFSEDLSGCSFFYNNNHLYKIDSSGNSDLMKFYYITRYCTKLFSQCLDEKSVSIRCMPFFINTDSMYYYTFQLFGFDDYSRVFSSYENYLNGVSYEDEAKQYIFYGSSDYAASDDSDVYVPDSSIYDNLVKNIEANSASTEQLAAALAAAQAANAKALEDVKDSIDSGNEATASALQKILDAVLLLPNSIVTNLNPDITSIKDFLSSLNKAIDNNLPVIQDVADNGALTVEKVNELVNSLNGALEKDGVLGGVNERVNDVAEDVNTLTKAISTAIDGSNSISVSVNRPIYKNNQEEPEDDFNLGIFGILFFLFSIFFKILRLFFDCLMFLFTLHNVKASPYFLNDGMLQGLNWMKKIGIKGELLNVSLYQFLFVLVRIVIIFSVVKLIRKWVNKL